MFSLTVSDSIETVNKSNSKSNILWTDQGKEYYKCKNG